MHELRTSQLEAVLNISSKIVGYAKEPNYIGLEAPTGWGKTRAALEVLRGPIQHFRNIMKGNDLKSSTDINNKISVIPGIDNRVYVFVRTRSQVQAFLRESENLGLNGLALPSKSYCCINNISGDGITEDIKDLFDDESKVQIDKTVKHKASTKASIEQVHSFIKGRCATCPLSVNFSKRLEDDKFAESHKKVVDAYLSYTSVHGSPNIAQAKSTFRSMLNKNKDIETTVSEFKKEFPLICPYSLALQQAIQKQYDILILTYPYLLDIEIQAAVAKSLFKDSIPIAILDECHNLDAIGNNMEIEITKKRLGSYHTNLKNLETLEAETFRNYSDKKELVQTQKLILKGVIADSTAFKMISDLCGVWIKNWDKVVKEWQGEIHLTPKAFSAIFGDIEKLKEFLNYSIEHIDIILSNIQDDDALAQNTQKFVKIINGIYKLINDIKKIADSYDDLYTENSINQDCNYRIYYNGKEENVKVKMLTYEELTKQVFSICSNVIFLSGTMPTTDYFNNMFGIDPYLHVAKDKIGDLKLVNVNGVTSKWSNRSVDTYKKYADMLTEVHTNGSKHTLAVATSNAFTNSVYKLMDVNNVWLGNEGTTVNDLLNHAMNSDRHIYFVPSGSRFSEGVEYVKDGRSMIDSIIIIGVPIAPPSLHTKDLQEFLINKHGLSSSESYTVVYLEPAWIKIRQTIGRGIRGMQDSCTAYLADDRFFDRYWSRKFEYTDSLSWE